MENYLLIGFLVIVFGLGFYFNFKASLKRNLMGGNILLQSKTTTELINNMESQEMAEQEQRLLKNERYRLTKSILLEELAVLKKLSLDEAKKLLPSGTTYKTIERDGKKLEISFYSELNTTMPTVKVMVYPKRFLGSLVAVEEWFYFENRDS